MVRNPFFGYFNNYGVKVVDCLNFPELDKELNKTNPE